MTSAGTAVLIARLIESGHIDGGCLTITGRRGGRVRQASRVDAR